MHCRNLEIAITISWFIFFQYVKQTFFSCQDFPQQISIKTKIKFYVVDDQFLDGHLYEELWLIEVLKKDVQLVIFNYLREDLENISNVERIDKVLTKVNKRTRTVQDPPENLLSC